jgi:hypothetical protein
VAAPSWRSLIFKKLKAGDKTPTRRNSLLPGEEGGSETIVTGASLLQQLDKFRIVANVAQERVRPETGITKEAAADGVLELCKASRRAPSTE